MNDFTVIKVKEKGFCVFSNKKFLIGELIGEYLTPIKNNIGRGVKKNLWETILGRFSNHWVDPNTKITLINGSYFLMSTSLIEVGDEITVDYQTVEKELSFNDGFFVNTIKPIPPLKNYGTETKRDNLTI